MTHLPTCPRHTAPFARCTCEAIVSPRSSPWAPAVDELMLSLRQKGFSFTQVAEQICEKWPERQVSRNAVKGRLDRLADLDRKKSAMAELKRMEEG